MEVVFVIVKITNRVLCRHGGSKRSFHIMLSFPAFGHAGFVGLSVQDRRKASMASCFVLDLLGGLR